MISKISKYFKELDKNSKEELKDKLGCDDSSLGKILGKLYEEGIIKVTGKDGRVLPVTDISKADSSCRFKFVGVIVIKGHVLKCYPKYLSEEPSKDDFRLIFEVIEKYIRESNAGSSIKRPPAEEIYDGSGDDSFNLLALMRWFLNDYYENGIYDNSKEIIEVNGPGEILWEKTVNETVAVISKKRPYYMELLTRKRVTDTYDYCKRLHEYVLTQISRELKKEDLLDLFRLTEVELTDEEREDFGDDEDILYRIEKELNVQFNTRKQLLLRNMHDYFSRKRSLYDEDCFELYGTTSFNLVWETVCARIMENCLEKTLKSLPLPDYIKSKYSKYDSKKEKKLIELMEKVKLKQGYFEEELEPDNDSPEEEMSKLKPDLISIENIDGNWHFIIFDAKYYTPVPGDGKNEKTKGLPGIGDVTKQYLYQLAYQPFIRECGLTPINCFLMPTEGETVDSFGMLTLNMLKELLKQMLGGNLAKIKGVKEAEPYITGNDELQDIQIRRLPARDAYDCYLLDRPYGIKSLKLCNKLKEERG